MASTRRTIKGFHRRSPDIDGGSAVSSALASGFDRAGESTVKYRAQAPTRGRTVGQCSRFALRGLHLALRDLRLFLLHLASVESASSIIDGDRAIDSILEDR